MLSGYERIPLLLPLVNFSFPVSSGQYLRVMENIKLINLFILKRCCYAFVQLKIVIIMGGEYPGFSFIVVVGKNRSRNRRHHRPFLRPDAWEDNWRSWRLSARCSTSRACGFVLYLLQWKCETYVNFKKNLYYPLQSHSRVSFNLKHVFSFNLTFNDILISSMCMLQDDMTIMT